jgi:hypothetical protein
MTFGEAMIAAVHGRLVRRPDWGGNWHVRFIAPIDGGNRTPRILTCEGWPHPVHWNPPDFDGDDVLAEDWEIVDPVKAIQCQVGEVGIWGGDEEEDE